VKDKIVAAVKFAKMSQYFWTGFDFQPANGPLSKIFATVLYKTESTMAEKMQPNNWQRTFFR
jgi:hypothetical protein